MLGGAESPILEMRLRDAKSEGLAAWLPFSGSGLTGLITPDMAVFGVGGRGLRSAGTGLCDCCSVAGTRTASGFGDGLLKRASKAFFCSEGTESRRSVDCCIVAKGTGDLAATTAGCAAAGCGDGPLNMSRRLLACAVGAGARPGAGDWFVDTLC